MNFNRRFLWPLQQCFLRERPPVRQLYLDKIKSWRQTAGVQRYAVPAQNSLLENQRPHRISEPYFNNFFFNFRPFHPQYFMKWIGVNIYQGHLVP